MQCTGLNMRGLQEWEGVLQKTPVYSWYVIVFHHGYECYSTVEYSIIICTLCKYEFSISICESTSFLSVPIYDCTSFLLEPAAPSSSSS